MDLTTRYLGLTLKTPLVASASPLNSTLDNLRRLEDAGAAAIVLPSLFQEQIEAQAAAQEALVDVYAESSPEALSYLPAAARGPYGLVPETYLELIRRGRDAIAIPIIASLNGTSHTGWTEQARGLEDAGAHALELNMYHIPTDLTESGRDVEARYVEIVAAVCRAVRLPVSVKLTPYVSAIGHFSAELVEHGAAGLVYFNRLLEPDIDIAKMTMADTLALSDPAEMRLPMLWIAIMAGRVPASLAASSGVATAAEVIKYLLAGADVVMTTSALLRHGTGYLTHLESGLRTWIAQHEFESLDDMRGLMSWRRSRDRSVYTRANYLRILEQYEAQRHSFEATAR